MSRTLPRINTSRTSTTTTDTNVSTNSDIALPIVPEIILNKNIETIESKETFKSQETFKYQDAYKSQDIETEKERLIRLKTIRAKYTFRFPTRPFDQFNTVSIKRSLSSAQTFTSFQRKKRIDLKPLHFNKKRNKQQKNLQRTCTDIVKKEDIMIIEEEELEQEKENQLIEENINGNSSIIPVL